MNKKIVSFTLVGMFLLGIAFGSFGVINTQVFAKENSTTVKDTTAIENQDKEVEEDKEDKDDINISKADVKISIQEAQKIALSSQKDAKILGTELEDEDGVIVYGVELQTNKEKYDIKIDANTGKILKSEKDDENEDNNFEKEDHESNDNDHEEVEE